VGEQRVSESGEAFHFDSGRPGESVLDQETRFWDQHELVKHEIAARPHDWAFDVQLGNVIQAPTYRFMETVFKKLRPRSVLDIGCGSGVYSRSMARYGGIRAIGVDLSPVQIATAKELAREAEVSHLVDYRVANAFEFTADERVDAICAFSALHHFPDIERHLPAIVERNLKPGGFILAAEPFYEGFHPAVLRLVSWIARSRWRRWFDVDRYEEIAAAAQRGETLLGESPAGLVHHHAPGALDAYLRSAFAPIAIHYTQLFAPFFANAFVIYQRSQRVAQVARRLVPAVVRFDSLLCRFRRWSRWAAVGLYAVRPRS
jgi:2-polyprenyl-3-methyl-5-hydroxy-6-metoxy-1,4-benzoquinol methylase